MIMKRLFISLAMVLATIGMAWSQKSYVNVVADHIYSSIYQEIYLTGDVPMGIKTHYDSYGSEAMTVGKVLNLLAKEGFVVDQMSCSAECEVVLLSRVSLYPDPDSVERIIDDSQEAVEVARYNLQGLPVSKDEKGIQIIVYSNYTTRTVIVE
jgi:hypothetical protein